MRKLKIEELGRVSIKEFKDLPKLPVVVVLDNIRSLNNVGSVFRTCDAFKIHKIYLSGITGQPPHRDIQKTALGATDSVDWEYVSNPFDLSEKLKSDGYNLISIEQTDESVSLNEVDIDRNQKYALVFGNEVFGVDQQVVSNSSYSIEIPQYGTKHSLNVSVSVGIVLWEFVKALS